MSASGRASRWWLAAAVVLAVPVGAALGQTTGGAPPGGVPGVPAGAARPPSPPAGATPDDQALLRALLGQPTGVPGMPETSGTPGATEAGAGGVGGAAPSVAPAPGGASSQGGGRAPLQPIIAPAVGGQNPVPLPDNVLTGETGPPPLKAGAADRTDVEPIARNTRIVHFVRRDHVSYAIRSRVGVFTHIELPDDERISFLVLSDNENWEFIVTKDERRVFIRPLVEHAVNTGTIITNGGRRYELTFLSVAPGQAWYQYVTWHARPQLASGGTGSPSYASADREEDGARAERLPWAGEGPLNGGYRIRGRAERFQLVTVVDDGRRTYFVFDERKGFPAIFAGEGRKARILPVEKRGAMLVAPEVAARWELRLGGETVRVRRDNGGWW